MFSIILFVFVIVVVIIFLSASVLLRQALLNPEEMKEHHLKILESRKGRLFKVPVRNSYILCYANFETNDNKIIIYCHGNSGNIFKKQPIIDLLEKECFSFCIFDYRGFGPTVNSFRPTIETMIEDTKEVLNLFSDRGFKITLWGESLGALIINKILKEMDFAQYTGFEQGINTRKCYNIQKVVLFSPFMGLKETLKSNGLSLLCILFPWARSLRMEKIEVPFPILVVFSEEDNLCSKNSIEKIFNCPNLQQVVIKGSHSRPKIKPDELMKIRDFLL